MFRHVQVRDREGRSTLLLINVTPDMQGEYRLVVVSFAAPCTVVFIMKFPLSRCLHLDQT